VVELNGVGIQDSKTFANLQKSVHIYVDDIYLSCRYICLHVSMNHVLYVFVYECMYVNIVSVFV
jgi:hypothetical protein